MVSIPKYVQEFFPGKMAWVATATGEGVPNVTPKGSVKVLDDQHVVFADLFSLKTRQNLEQNPKVAVTVIDASTHKGYQVKGTAELLSSGPLYDQMAADLKAALATLPVPKYVVKISVESVYDQSVGPDAGKQIA
jgi:predicted pyridoxine 5'-phosphate oxidase superfamily flavin-nucleotide-binding protein